MFSDQAKSITFNDLNEEQKETLCDLIGEMYYNRLLSSRSDITLHSQLKYLMLMPLTNHVDKINENIALCIIEKVLNSTDKKSEEVITDSIVLDREGRVKWVVSKDKIHKHSCSICMSNFDSILDKSSEDQVILCPQCLKYISPKEESKLEICVQNLPQLIPNSVHPNWDGYTNASKEAWVKWIKDFVHLIKLEKEGKI